MVKRQSKSIAVTSYRSMLYLLDVDLPKLSGWDALLKMKEENPDVRVVIATGFLEPENED